MTFASGAFATCHVQRGRIEAFERGVGGGVDLDLGFQREGLLGQAHGGDGEPLGRQKVVERRERLAVDRTADEAEVFAVKAQVTVGQALGVGAEFDARQDARGLGRKLERQRDRVDQVIGRAIVAEPDGLRCGVFHGGVLTYGALGVARAVREGVQGGWAFDLRAVAVMSDGMGECVLLWFKRDLRVADNPALRLAAERGVPVLPVFIVEPEAWAQPDASARQYRFVAESLEALRGDLAGLGAPLVVRVGPALEVLQGLCARFDMAEIVSAEETGNAWSYARDRAVGAWARAMGVVWTEVPQLGVVRRLAGRDGWAARRERAVRQPVLAAPVGLRGDPAVGAVRSPRLRQLGLGFMPVPRGNRADARGG
jgi:hypothetical protein